MKGTRDHADLTRDYFAAHPEEKFILILDEAHLYRGANGTEVAYLIRRFLDRLGVDPARVIFIATSASFSNAEAAKEFVAGLSGMNKSVITTLAHRLQCRAGGADRRSWVIAQAERRWCARTRARFGS